MNQNEIAFNNIWKTYVENTGDGSGYYGIMRLYKFFFYVKSIYKDAEANNTQSLTLKLNYAIGEAEDYKSASRRLLEGIAAGSNTLKDEVNEVLGIKKRGRKKTS